MKIFITVIILISYIFLYAQVPYINLQFDFPSGLSQGTSTGLIETDSFYYFGGAYNGGCDTGVVIKLNKYDLSVNYFKINENNGSRIHNIISLANEDDIILTGTTYDCVQTIESIDFYIAKLSADSLIDSETRVFGILGRAEIANHAILDNQKNVVMTGWSFDEDNPGHQSILVFKADSNFNEIFYRRYPSSSPQYNHFGNDIVATPDGGYIVVGNHRLPNSEDAALIFKIDSMGNTLWWHEFDPDHELDEENLFFTGIEPKENGEYIVVGYKRINPQLFLEYMEYWVVGLSSEGEFLWENQFGENYRTSAVQITPSGDDNFLFCGGETDLPNETNYWQRHGTVGKITPQGDLLWLRKYSEEQAYANADIFWNVIPTQDGGMLCVGSTNPNDEERQNIWVMKLDSYGCAEPGCETWVGTIELPVGSPILVYPNPTAGQLKIAARDERTPIDQVAINDTQGRLIFQQKYAHAIDVELDLSEQVAGVYFIRIEMGGVWYVRSVVVK